MSIEKNFQVIKKFYKKLEEISKLKDGWDSDRESKAPTKDVIKFSKELIFNLIYRDNPSIPVRVDATVEEGICFVFENKSKDRIMHLEIYNDGDVGFIINEKSGNRDIIDNRDISRKEIESIVNEFVNN